MKLLVDVGKLEADGTITPQQAVQIRRAAAADTGTFAINVIAAIGAFAGVIAVAIAFALWRYNQRQNATVVT